MTTRTLAILLLSPFSLACGFAATAQSTSVYGPERSSSARLPAPVRHVQHEVGHPASRHQASGHQASGHQVMRQPEAGVWVGPDGHIVHGPASVDSSSHAHQVIRAPGLGSASNQRHGGKSGGARGRLARQHAETHPPHLSLQRRIQPEPATIPAARQRETWKTPYSYGYFGASGKRQWSRHYGYRDRYTEWRLH